MNDEIYDAKEARIAKRSTGPWGFNNEIYKNGKLYMRRSWIGRLRLHIFHMGDVDRDPHDHPWAFWTFPFTSYVEEVTEKVTTPVYVGPERIHVGYEDDGRTPIYVELQTMDGGWEDQISYRTRLQVVPAWRWNYRPAEHCHRVLGPWRGGCRLIDQKEFTIYRDADWLIYHPQYEPFAESFNGDTLTTIVWRTGFQRMWGFLKTRDGKWCWQDFKSYLADGGSPGPCQ